MASRLIGHIKEFACATSGTTSGSLKFFFFYSPLKQEFIFEAFLPSLIGELGFNCLSIRA